MSLHIELANSIEKLFGQFLDVPIEQKQDAMIIRLNNGVTIYVRYAAADAYSLRWTYGNAEAGIDTAPLHRDLSTFPNHFHDANNRILADPVTRPDAAPDENLRQLIQRLVDEPMFGTR